MSAEATTVWTKIVSSMGGGKSHDFVILRYAGCIPVHDEGVWRVFKNTLTIYPGAENCADPAKVDALRENAKSLLEHYPETVPQLEKLGVRVRALVNKPITDFEGVVAWALSIFNTGPVSKLPPHVHDTVDIAYGDVVIGVKHGRDAVYVIPAAPRGEGIFATLDFSVPGSKTRYGPRHDYTRLAFAKQVPQSGRKARYRGTTADGEPRRLRGRPRKDGLMPGSAEAKAADEQKEAERQAGVQQRREARAAKRAEKLAATQLPKAEKPPEEVASITNLPRRKKRLARKGDQQQAKTS